MGALLGVVLLFVGILVLWAMLLTFPSVFIPLVDFQQRTPGTDGLGGYGEFHLFILVFVVPLVFIGMLVVVVFVGGSMRQEAHRERF